ncbi:MAG TPA: peptide chain release factor N(5)-glutamine methyltransferase [Clostridiales bacterium]|jgi:release factor glutamine methyltransferase|nr:peptide chain release factor N(5)-glutamine methyltransferase [Clostridiales bacterium]
MTFRQALKAGEERLLSVGIEEAAHDSLALLSHAIEKDAADVLLFGGSLSTEQQETFDRLVERRAARYPLQYILGESFFMGLGFYVDENVLIPRFDTECVCEAALENLPQNARVLDLCTGSGALAIAIKKTRPDATVDATELSPAALEIAKKNAKRNGVEIQFYLGDLFAQAQGYYDLIVSNPPYVPKKDWESLQEEVKHEPRMALDGGDSGFDVYKRIIDAVKDYLKPDGRLVLEAGDGQAETLVGMLKKRFKSLHVRNDLAGRPRTVIAQNLK